MIVYYVYTITNEETSSVYVGQTKNPGDRWTEHLRDLKRGVHFNVRLQRSFTLHGMAAFTYAVVGSYATVAESSAAEAAGIARYTVEGRSYNLKTDVTLYGGAMSDEARHRMSQAHIGPRNYQYGRRGPDSTTFGKAHPDDGRQRISATKIGEKNPMWRKPGTRLGRPMTEEAKAKLSAARMGKIRQSPEQRAAQSARMTGEGNPFYGRTHSPESLATMRTAHKGQPSANKGRPSPLRGRTLSDETRAKMRVAARASWAKRKAQACSTALAPTQRT